MELCDTYIGTRIIFVKGQRSHERLFHRLSYLDPRLPPPYRSIDRSIGPTLKRLHAVRAQRLSLEQALRLQQRSGMREAAGAEGGEVEWVAGEAGIQAPLDSRLVLRDVGRVERDPEAGQGAVFGGILDGDVELRQALDVGAVGLGVVFEQLRGAVWLVGTAGGR
jgi:hypothetical protein